MVKHSEGFMAVKGGGGGMGSSGIVIHSEVTFCKADSDFTLRNTFGFSTLLLTLLVPGISCKLVVGTMGTKLFFEVAGEFISDTDGVRLLAAAMLFDVATVRGGGTGEVVGLTKITSSS